MSDQHFNERVDYAAGRDVNITQNYGSTNPGDSLRRQRWANKHYAIGKSITAGELTFLFMGLLIFSIWWFPATSNPLQFSLQSVFTVAFFAIAFVGAQVSAYGFAGIPHTHTGVVRDIHRHVFIGQLDGEGSLCPKCKAQLHFVLHLGSTPILKCTRNINHSWSFDFTAVQD
jgi:hypothetical protein